MSRLKSYFDDEHEQPPTTTDTPSETETPALAELLDRSPEEVSQILRLLDGMEDYPKPPVYDDTTILPDVGVEGFMDVIDTIWRRIKRWIAQIKKWLQDDLILLNTSVRTLIFSAENLEVALKTSTRIGGYGTIPVNSVAALSVFYKTPKEIGQVTSGLRILTNTLKTYLDYVDQTVVKSIPRVTNRIRSVEPDANVVELNYQLGQELERISPITQIDRLGMSVMPSDQTKYTTIHLLGNQRLVFSGFSGDRLTQILSHNLRLRHSELTPRRQPTSFELPRFGRNAASQCISQNLKLLRLIEQHTNSDAARRRRQALDSMESAIDTLFARIRRNESPSHKGALEEIMGISRVLVDWTNNPYAGLVTTGLRSSRAALRVCKLNII